MPGKKLEKVRSGIPGFDALAHGGIPKGRLTIVSGSTGTGKTLFCLQFLYMGASQFGENGVFVTFEERPDDLVKNLSSFGWDVEGLMKAKKFAIVDVTGPDPEFFSGNYDLSPLLLRIEHAVKKVGAKRVALDPGGSFFGRFSEAKGRELLMQISYKLKDLGVTTVMSSEQPFEDGPIKHRMEEFAADNVILLRNLTRRKRERSRSVEILKFRGSSHEREQACLIIGMRGLEAFGWPKLAVSSRVIQERCSMGISGLDEMMRGGVFRTSGTLITGTSGTGKTLMSLHFVMEGLRRGERCVFVSFEEGREQLVALALGFGWDLEKFEKKGLLVLHCAYPEEAELAQHLAKFESIVKRHKAQRVAIDSISALMNAFEVSVRDFVKNIVSFCKSQGAALVMTLERTELIAARRITDAQVSTATDNIVLLKFVEQGGALGLIAAVLKMRGSGHDNKLRFYSISDKGISIGEAASAIEGVLSGSSRKVGKSTGEKIRDELMRTLGPMGQQAFDELERQGLSEAGLKGFVDSLVRDGVMARDVAGQFVVRLNAIWNGDMAGFFVEKVDKREKKDGFFSRLGG